MWIQSLPTKWGAEDPSGGALARTPLLDGRNLRPNDVASLFATGLGPTACDYPEGEIVPAASQTRDTPKVSLGGLPATVLYSGLVSLGLYQLKIRIPNVATGEQALIMRIAGITSLDRVSLLISQ